MAGIAGINAPHREKDVEVMLAQLRHRGRQKNKILSFDSATIGGVWSTSKMCKTSLSLRRSAVWDTLCPPLPYPEALSLATQPFALAAIHNGRLFLARDPFGVRPLYYGRTSNGALAFASEVKALLPVTRQVHEFPIAHWYDQMTGYENYIRYNGQPVHNWLNDLPSLEANSIENHAQDLNLRLEQAVIRRLPDDEVGLWMSGGVNSAALAAITRPHVRKLHAFVAGLEGAPDLEYARQVAEHLDCAFQAVVFTQQEAVRALPEVIYALESFDPPLVRSALVMFMAARRAAECVAAVFSGDGGDELFAGYSAAGVINPQARQAALLDGLNCMHNTTLQRMDRIANAFGLTPYAPYMDLEVTTFIWRIVRALGQAYEDQNVEKWILTKAVGHLLPQAILQRPKLDPTQGAGLNDGLTEAAQGQVSDSDFEKMRLLPNGRRLADKEEAWYYRMFTEHFGKLTDLNWMGRLPVS